MVWYYPMSFQCLLHHSLYKRPCHKIKSYLNNNIPNLNKYCFPYWSQLNIVYVCIKVLLLPLRLLLLRPDVILIFFFNKVQRKHCVRLVCVNYKKTTKNRLAFILLTHPDWVTKLNYCQTKNSRKEYEFF